MDNIEWLEEQVKEQERKRFKKESKQIKKKIIKAAKQFKGWDYGFLLCIIEPCLELMSKNLGNKYITPVDTEWEDNNAKEYNGIGWTEYTTKLKEAYELIKTRNDNINLAQEDEKKLKKAFNIIAKYIMYWWN